HPGSKKFPRERLVRLREAETREAVAILRLPPERLAFLHEPDTKAPREGAAFGRVVERVSRLASCFRCSCILAPWRVDPHCDHEAAHCIAAAIAAKLGIRHMSFPVWGWTLPPGRLLDAGAATGWRLNISGHLSRKMEAIHCYRSQYRGLIADD